MTSTSPRSARASVRARRIFALVLASSLVGGIVAIAGGVAASWSAAGAQSTTPSTAPTREGHTPEQDAAAPRPFVPDAANGYLPHPVSVEDDDLPAIAALDPALRSALGEAAAVAAKEGVEFHVTMGWRSREYQRWLLDDAIRTYGSAEVARQFVATPDESHHVTGDAVDIGNFEAQLWLEERGWHWGLCRIFANEPWHFELSTAPSGECPAMRADAAS